MHTSARAYGVASFSQMPSSFSSAARARASLPAPPITETWNTSHARALASCSGSLARIAHSRYSPCRTAPRSGSATLSSWNITASVSIRC
jgi:hypothetical protein